MSSNSPVLSLPYLEPAQSQKHVTHNEALQLLDVLVQLVVSDRTLFAPPAANEEGDRYIVAANPSGAWAGRAHHIAVYTGNHWQFIEPQAGWSAHVRDEDAAVIWTGTAWRSAVPEALSVASIGISATADDLNRLSLSSPASLFNHAGHGHQIKVNKAAPSETASLLFQSDYSGRAEMGLTGNDNFAVKVSEDGNGFVTALTVARSGGQVGIPNGLAVDGTVSGSAVQTTSTDTGAGRLLRVGAFGLGGLSNVIGDAATTANSIAPGFYHFDTSAGSAGGPVGLTFGSLIHMRRAVGGGETQMVVCQAPDAMAGQIFTRARGSGNWSAWRTMWDKGATTVDSNGFLKQASPIVRLFATHIEEPVEPTLARFERSGTGRYALHGTMGLAQKGWQVEVPRDHNGTPLMHAAITWTDEVLHVATGVPEWVSGRLVAGEAMDIPEGRWVDIRLHKIEYQSEADPV